VTIIARHVHAHHKTEGWIVPDVLHAEARQVLSAKYDVGTRTTAMIFRDGTRDSIESGDAE
jgi:hypothetical protein